MKGWESCKNILCIRADNMGDVLMSSPALRALKGTFKAKITLLTSKGGSLITPYLPEIDQTLCFDLPWVKNESQADGDDLQDLLDLIRSHDFDAVVIFTVYSQSALPAALFSLLADIPRRLAYSRENPYNLLTDWLPDQEPFDHILHQVDRDLDLVKFIGATPSHERFSLQVSAEATDSAGKKISGCGIPPTLPFLILHPGVSEEKRKYPADLWVAIGKQLLCKYHVNLLITGSGSERDLAESIASGIGKGAHAIAGDINIEEFIILIAKSKAVVSVNTSTIHIAAATQTPTVVLYAQTNPQHTPWKSPYTLLPFSVKQELKSKNILVRFVSEKMYSKHTGYPSPSQVCIALDHLLKDLKQALTQAGTQ